MTNVFRNLILLWSFATVVFPTPLFAQGAGDSPGSDSVFEMGFHLGNLLPNQIGGVTEIMGLGGARMGLRMNPGQYFEAGIITGNGEGQEWKNLHADIRIDVPVENLVALAYVGADAIYYTSPGRSNKLVFGGHAGGGMQMHLGGVTWFRADMKFGFSPGTSLYIGAGFSWRL